MGTSTLNAVCFLLPRRGKITWKVILSSIFSFVATNRSWSSSTGLETHWRAADTGTDWCSANKIIAEEKLIVISYFIETSCRCAYNPVSKYFTVMNIA